MDDLSLLPFALVILAAVLAVGWWRAATRIGRHNRRRQAAARRGEHGAETLVRKRGYRVLDRQVTGRWTLWVDGAERPVHCRADLLLERRGRRYIAEVKTGDRAPDPANPATRRQLLEYLIAFRVDGVLLVDMVTRRICEVGFPEFDS